MGVHNRQRRAARQRERAADRRRAAGASRATSDQHFRAAKPTSERSESRGPSLPPESDDRPPRSDSPHANFTRHTDDPDREERAARQLYELFVSVEADPSIAPALAHRLLRPGSLAADYLSPQVAGELDGAMIVKLLSERLSAVLDGVIQNGWTPSDLGQVVRRRRTAAHLSPLAGLIQAVTAKHPPERTAPAWQVELGGLGPAARLDLRTVPDVALALGLGSLFVTLPKLARTISPPGSASPTARADLQDNDRQRLAKVRALLAKAESTEYAEEAEALSAKAQEIASRYALEHLLHEPLGTDGETTTPGVETRRIWIDAPYVYPKALLVGAVARANRCSCVVSERMGFSTVLGSAYDLEAVELLATSLLVQANRAMLGHGRQVGWAGQSRTAPFRRSFLISYAVRIGERLTAASDQAAEETGRARELVPVLRGHAERVEAARHELFPEVRTREAHASDREGWALGRAAADHARLDIRPPLTSSARL